MSDLGPPWYHLVDSVLSNSHKQEVEKVYESYTYATMCENFGVLVSDHHYVGDAELNNLEDNIDNLLALLECSSEAGQHPLSSEMLSRYSLTENFISKYSQA